MTTTPPVTSEETNIQVQRNELATAQLSAQAIAFEQAAFLVAHKRPRDMDLVRQKLMKECDRTSFAATAIYRKPVGNTTVMGLSIRYAEAALNVLGNARTKRIVTLDDLTRRKILIVVSDLETNTHYEAEITIEKTVERRSLKEGQNPLGSRLNSRGERVYLVEATEDDMLTKESAIASKFIRQNALRLIPGWLQDECYDAIMETQKNKAIQDPDAEKNKIVDVFDEMGIRVDQLKSYLGLDDLSALMPKDLIELRAVYQALKDGETNWREVMEQRESVRGKKEEAKPSERSSSLADKLRESVAKLRDEPANENAGPAGDGLVTQECHVTDLEVRNRKGKGQYILLTCHVPEAPTVDLPVSYFHKTHFERLKSALGKDCVFGLKRNVSEDETVHYTLEKVIQIGEEKFD